MRIEITDNNGETKKYTIDNDRAVIGRRRDCDVSIDSEFISREHLEVEVRGESVYIKDITSNNWVSYNDEKLPKGEPIQYFSFSDLLLPGKFQVKIKPGRSFEIDDEFLDETHTTTKGLIRKSQENRSKKTMTLRVDKPKAKIRDGRRGLDKSKKVDPKKFQLSKGVITALIILGLVVVYVFLDQI